MGLCMLFKGGDGLEEDGATLQLVSERGPLFIWKYQYAMAFHVISDGLDAVAAELKAVPPVPQINPGKSRKIV